MSIKYLDVFVYKVAMYVSDTELAQEYQKVLTLTGSLHRIHAATECRKY